MTVTQRISKWFFYLIVFPATLGLCGWQGWVWWSWANAPADAATEQPATAEQPATTEQPATAEQPATTEAKTVQFQIPEGTSAQQIGQDLEAAGLIRSTTAWNLWTRWQTLQNREGGFLAGTYALSPSEPMEAIANKIWRGEVVHLSFTIPEGWSTKEMAEYFEEQGFFTAQEFLAATRQVPRDQYPWLPQRLPLLEGFLYPDTYQVEDEVTPESVINQMLDRFEQVALPVYQQGQTQFSLLEWVTLASIVEREAVISEERPQIASVFARRLRENIPLGADPTVEYALGIRQTPEQPLTLDEVNTPSPYNTYVNTGLPPTPIASPGVSSLEASLNPADTEYLFFVARYDGTHVFSRTLAEHEAAQAAIQDDIAAQQQGSEN
ncbi:endolytic transglycosylase MltG [Leptolyngbya sp. FACHB-541]|uniref:endolytic transglycosylase MltG n=1 Tax=Leptolyngbya sp. FACHB-541 TaxID=2692810 RepID=UPI0016889B69|nr:endolytic transglycosylase MltG [Leptolyngbya sp. FACHB-541]MBD1996379.1 endolytic transglycosylase MltG [Leptolyngbya sp. FACHB-541]